ncbi:hypothetical protein KY339_05560 [Candidatus Woesearchaeota archaeon]|nr:hypothetical protein [Candidatus Woesearchaeota archaeon]
MKHFYVVRHGHYDRVGRDYHLSLTGEEEMKILSSLMKQVSDSSFFIATSPENVAIGSARVLAGKLGVVSLEESLDLWSGGLAPEEGNYFGDYKRVHDFVMERKDRADSLIIVSHKEITGKYPTYFSREEMKVSVRIPAPEKGHAIYFDLERKIHRMFPMPIEHLKNGL